ncbi:PTS IIA-like nitrogen regulatory protein PtsN [Paraferrimonas sp. SM1919]|uniref:PTS IIA-like nitrogen regulatory protein PtsN n=1 Tax=Paraferrimonas sp. SM1919 TaxID=2662263 RepID=UPI0013CF5F18|nr:PTS IIA-like nitrogen regulatory protein PtsN [Paraferrimonas sp. SM1919]
MEISNLLAKECVICTNISSKKKVLELISRTAAIKTSDVTAQQFFEALINRERMGSTGIGNGIAIPHGKLDNLKAPIAVLIKCDHAIEFDAMDNKPVDILFALFVPTEDCQAHLSTLSQVAQLFGDKSITKKLRRAQDNEQLYQVINP